MKELKTDMQRYSDDEDTYDPLYHAYEDEVEDDFDEEPNLEAQRFMRPRDRQVDKRASQAKLRKAASKEYR